jgi:hypothetical protein
MWPNQLYLEWTANYQLGKPTQGCEVLNYNVDKTPFKRNKLTELSSSDKALSVFRLYAMSTAE